MGVIFLEKTDCRREPKGPPWRISPKFSFLEVGSYPTGQSNLRGGGGKDVCGALGFVTVFH